MEFPIHPAPYRVVTDRLELRCPEVADVQAIHEGILESLDALRPWMPWVSNDPVPLSERAKVVRDLRAGFDRGKDFTFMVFRRDTGRFVGGMGLHPRVGTGGLELGYWVRTSEQGRGQAVEGASALIRVGLEHVGADRIEIRIELDNGPSQRVVEKLGVPREATLRRRFHRAGDFRDVHVFTVFRSTFAGSPASRVSPQCFGAAGESLRARFPFAEEPA